MTQTGSTTSATNACSKAELLLSIKNKEKLLVLFTQEMKQSMTHTTYSIHSNSGKSLNNLPTAGAAVQGSETR